MDPLSVAASVAGMEILTIRVSGAVGSYCKAVKDTTRSAEEINQQFLLLLSALQQLETFFRPQALKYSSFGPSSILAMALLSCRDSIDAVFLRLPNPGYDNKSHAISRLKWPFSEKEIQKRLEALRGCTSTFLFALTIDG